MVGYESVLNCYIKLGFFFFKLFCEKLYIKHVVQAIIEIYPLLTVSANIFCFQRSDQNHDSKQTTIKYKMRK